MEQNKTGKYLKYAIGEVVLVMVGILLALQVNNWNERVKNKERELKLLQEMVFSIKEDISLNEYTLGRNKSSLQSVEILINHLENSYPYHDSLSFHFANAHNRWVGLLKKNAFESSKSYGLDFIKQDSIKTTLIHLYQSSYEYLKQLDDRNNQYYYNIAVPELTDLFKTTYPQGELFESMPPRDYLSLLSNKKYSNILNSFKAYKQQYIRWQQYLILNNLKQVNVLLENEIKENY